MTKPRVLYIVGQLGGGGLERQLGYLLKAMDRDRLRPKVAVWNYNEQDVNVKRIKALSIELIPVPRSRSRFARLLWLRRTAAVLAPEVVHSYSFFTNLAAQFAAGGATSMGSVRADFVRDRVSTGPILGRACARWPRSQVCNSSAAATAIRRSKSFFKPYRVFLVRNALDLAQFPVREIPQSGPPLILGIGSLVRFKRWDRLIQLGFALSNLKIPTRIRIVGEGPERPRLQSMIMRLHLQDVVDLPGYKYDIPEMLAAASLVVHTSESEGYPNVIMEAMAAGRPVVATNSGDSADLIDQGLTGYVVAIGDEDALTQRVAEVVTNASLIRTMGTAARNRAESMFRPERLVHETLDAYRSLGWNG